MLAEAMKYYEKSRKLKEEVGYIDPNAMKEKDDVLPRGEMEEATDYSIMFNKLASGRFDTGMSLKRKTNSEINHDELKKVKISAVAFC